MSQKFKWNMCHANVNLTVDNATRTKSGIMINICLSAKVKKNTCEKYYIWNPIT